MDRIFISANVLAALATHVCLNRFDPPPLPLTVIALAALPACHVYLLSSSPSLLSFAYILYYLTLLCSVCTYRLSPFHPLAKYPGPFILKITKLWPVWIAYKGKTHVHYKALHDKYGPIVRIGPNELSTIEKSLIPQILGNQGMPKGPIWNGRRIGQAQDANDYDGVVDVRDLDTHAELRKPWIKAFTAQPMRDYEELLVRRVIQLNGHLRELCDLKESEDGTAQIDIAQWISYFSYDFMGDLAFAGNFQLMRTGDPDGNIESMGRAMYLLSIIQHARWISRYIRALPYVNAGMQQFMKFGVEQGIRRSGLTMKRKDLFYHMIEASGGSSSSDLSLIIRNVLLAIVAGSDTASSVMSNTIYLLLSHPGTYERLQREVDQAFDEHGIGADFHIVADVCKTYSDVLNGMAYLNAVINETLRLFPAVPSSIQRAPAKGSGGRLLQTGSISIFLPEENGITIPPYVIHRDPRYFSPHPDVFIPDRWLSPASPTPTYTTSRDAFIPFSTGPANCVGRSLALMEMRYCIASLVWSFNLEFNRERNDPGKWEGDLEDRFTFSKGVLGVSIKKRKHVH